MFLGDSRETHSRAIGIHIRHTRADRLATRCYRAVQEQAVQDLARIDHDRMAHLEPRAMAAARNELRGANNPFGLWRIEQERIGFDCFVREPAAAGLFPCQSFVKNRDLETGGGQALAAEGAGRSSTNNRDLFHGSVMAACYGRIKSVEISLQ